MSTTGTGTLAQAADAGNTTTDVTISPATLATAAASTNIDLIASDTVTFSDDVTLTNLNTSLTVTAGVNIVATNISITTNGGGISFFAGDVISLTEVDFLTAGGAILMQAGSRVTTSS